MLLSLVLTAVLMTCAGCSLLLFGNERAAFDRIVKASTYFKYPSSVRIVSGQMNGDTLYCELKAKNGFGNYRYGTYSISKSGYLSDSSSYRCASTSGLNIQTINSALDAHFGGSGQTGLAVTLLTGRVENMEFIIIIAVIVVLVINGILASSASNVAEDKGYEKRTWFHMCFWLGPISYIIVAAMPDMTLRREMSRTNSMLEKLIELQEKAPAAAGAETQAPQAQPSLEDEIRAELPRL